MITRELPTEPGRYLWRVPSDNKWIYIEVFRIGLSRSFAARGDIYRNGIFEEFTEADLHDWKQQVGEWYRIPDPEEVCEWSNKKPRKIPKTASWTIREEAVTCPKCLAILKTIP